MTRWLLSALFLFLLSLTVCFPASAQDIRKGGKLVGKIESDGSIRKNGSLVGKIESDGDVRVGGSLAGKVESDGDVRKGGSIIGSARGVKKEYAAALFFFGFFDF
jgi:hypothetical protein